MTWEERARLPDPMDHSAQTTEDLLNASVKTTRAKVAPEQHPDFDGKHCVGEDCGIPIPAARLAMGRVRCVDCQARREEVARRKGPNET